MNPDKLFNYLDGRLAPKEREELEDQLVRDPELQREFAVARRIHQGMSGDAREVILDELPPGGARGRQIIRQVMIVFVVLIFINILGGLVVIGLVQTKRHRTQTASEQNRQELNLALQKAAADALPTPSLEIDEIKITVPAKQQDAMVAKISAAANQAGGSAAKNLSNENGTLVFAEVPVSRLTQFHEALMQLGAVLPASPSPSANSPSPDGPAPATGNAILQIRILERSE